MRLMHFYHAWCDGQWLEPVEEHLFALRDAGFAGGVTVGLAGRLDQRARCRGMFRELFPDCETIEAPSGWEEMTVKAAWRYAWSNPDAALLYCHTKGATGTGVAGYRRSLTGMVVGRWRDCVAGIEAGYDAVGPDCDQCTMAPGHFPANFWWASCAYLRLLPEPGVVRDRYLRGRHAVEGWLGCNEPRVLRRLPERASAAAAACAEVAA